MATTTQHSTSQHLDNARMLLDGLASDANADAQTRATEAVAHSILVLAEQVAAARLILAADAAEGMAPKH